MEVDWRGVRVYKEYIYKELKERVVGKEFELGEV